MSITAVLADILFVGHSLVGPNLPPLLEAALGALGQPAQVQAQVINGASLAYNWDHSTEAEGVDARAVLAAGGVNTLILTEAQPMAEQIKAGLTAPRIADFATLARAGNPQVQVYLYETWGPLAEGEDPALWEARIAGDLVLWQQAAVDAVAAGGGAVGLIPAGQAMAALSKAASAGAVPGATSVRDFLVDGQHPNGKGLYFLAMVHAAALTGQSPVGLPPKLTRKWPTRDSVMDAAMAGALQTIAQTAVTSALPAPPAPSVSQLAAAHAALPAATPVAPAAPAPGLPENLTPITNPNLGFGLAGVNDWSVQLPFLDLMKSARPWVGHLPGQWGGWEQADLARVGALDASGWPLRLPSEVTAISTLILTDLPPDAAGAAGRYGVTWAGGGDLVVEGRAQIAEQAPHRITFDYTPGEGSVLITLKAIDPADPIRAIQILREDRAAMAASGEIFNPDFLQRLKGVRLVRFMDWFATNNSTLATLQDRPRPGDYTYARQGVPIEVAIALANKLHANPWLTVPHLAQDALVQDWAEVTRQQLDPGLVAHVEFSNEVWNWQFAQATWAEAQGRARWGQDGTWLQYYGLRAAEVARIWRATFQDSPARLVTILSTQTGVKGAETQILDAPLAQAEGLPAPSSAFNAWAVTGYFAALLGDERKAPMVREWLERSAAAAESQATAQADPPAYLAAHRYDLAFSLAAAELQNGAESGDPEDTLARLLGEVLPWQASVAADHGLTLMMYEGGSHVVGYGPIMEDAQLTEFFTALNYSFEMGELYAQLLAGWRMLSDAPFNAFVDTYRPGKWGSWGALRHLGDDNPRWQALAGCPTC